MFELISNSASFGRPDLFFMLRPHLIAYFALINLVALARTLSPRERLNINIVDALLHRVRVTCLCGGATTLLFGVFGVWRVCCVGLDAVL